MRLVVGILFIMMIGMFYCVGVDGGVWRYGVDVSLVGLDMISFLKFDFMLGFLLKRGWCFFMLVMVCWIFL